MEKKELKEMTIDTVGTSLMKLFIQHAQDLKKPWAQMSKHQQDDTLDAIRAGVQEHVKQAVELIAAREGAILPLITSPADERMLHRLVTEKTITINTTAAGGNASLMTMADNVG